jgi:hypothetical protein
MVVVIDTLTRSGLVGAIPGRFLIVAVPMEQLEVHQPVVPSKGLRNDVVYLQHVSISYVQSTESTPSLLELQQVAYLAIHQWMVFQPLRPVHQVAIVGTGRTSYLSMALDGCC